jgi:hypothetical protein
MIKNKDEGVPYYSKYFGACDSHFLNKNMFINSNNVDFIKNLKAKINGKTIKAMEDGTTCISYAKKHNYHLSHITAYITAYQRLSMLHQLMSMNSTAIIRICVDGIYTLENINTITLHNVFRKKSDLTFNNKAGSCYCSSVNTHEGFIENKRIKLNSFNSIERDFHISEFHRGGGGSGKTHKILIDSGLIKPLYVAPSWKLCRNKSNEYNVKSNVLANLLTIY